MKTTAVLFVCAAVAAQVLSAQARHPRAVRRHAHHRSNTYIVTLATEEDPQAVGLETAMLHRGKLKHVFRTAARGFAINLPAAEATILADDPRVAQVEEDTEVRATLTRVSESAPPWGLDRIDQRTLPLDGVYRYIDALTPVYVHVIDTGVRTSHVEFDGRASSVEDYVNDGINGEDCNGHGTHVAATIAGTTDGVAKHALILSHRVLNCSGVGSLSDVIAALDAVAADARRPAVANLSLAMEDVSDAFDAAVRSAIASGVPVVVAAGNAGVDASTRSPSRVSEAITVAAVDRNDIRAGFSNYGDSVDLFAPGVDIASAWYTSDTATAWLSGTSMAAPHVTGVVALFLAAHESTSPADVATAVITATTPGAVVDPGVGSPNRLLYSGRIFLDKPAVRLAHPNGGEIVFTGTAYTIEWAVSDSEPLSAFDVLLSTDGGSTFTPVPACTALAADARSCQWSAPSPSAESAIVKVVALNALGNTGSDVSNAPFSIADGEAAITITAPNKPTNWARGSIREIRWTHNLGPHSHVRVELSRDGGTTFPQALAIVRNGASSGVFKWRVDEPDTADAVIRVSWTSGPVADTSDVPLTIAAPFLNVSTVTSATNWGFGTAQRVEWSTNLGPYDLIAIDLGTDTELSDPVRLVDGVAASKTFTIVIAPTGTATDSAHLRLSWINAPEEWDVSSGSDAFTIAEPFVNVISPNGGETWRAGKVRSIFWAGNLGVEAVRIDLSLDAGNSYSIPIAASRANTGTKSILVGGGWLTSEAKIQVAWTANTAIADQSDGTFQIR